MKMRTYLRGDPALVGRTDVQQIFYICKFFVKKTRARFHNLAQASIPKKRDPIYLLTNNVIGTITSSYEKNLFTYLYKYLLIERFGVFSNSEATNSISLIWL